MWDPRKSRRLCHRRRQMRAEESTVRSSFGVQSLANIEFACCGNTFVVQVRPTEGLDVRDEI